GCERARVLGRRDREAVRATEAPDRRNSGRNRIVPESGSFGEDEHRVAGLRLRLRVARAGDQAGGRDAEQDRRGGRKLSSPGDPHGPIVATVTPRRLATRFSLRGLTAMSPECEGATSAPPLRLHGKE